jgi:protein TonB
VAKTITAETPEEVFKEVAQVPQFPGGDTALFRFLGDHVKYPNHEEELHVDGSVRAKFIVDKSGKIRNIEIVKHATPAMDQEVIRVISAMPAWTPGRNEKGEAVSVYFQIPITFKSYKQNDHVTFTAKLKKV